MFLFADGMNRSLHSRDQQGDLSWVPESWEHPSSLGELETRQHQGGRLDWDWESPLMLSQNTTGVTGGACDGDADADAARKLHLLSSLLRPCYGLLPSSIGSQIPQDQIGLLASSGMQSLAADVPSSMHTMPSAHAEFGLSSNFSGLGGACISGDIRFDTRRHLLGIMGLDQKGLNDFVKPHDLYAAEAHGRIGLNLGVRTYFSTEDSLFGRFSKRARANSPGSQVPMCQAEGCKADLNIAKHYHRRHKVCELHSKAVQVVTNGQNQRFCQQCSRFHPLSEFDEGKRSCRKRLADHNRRRRKPQPSSSTFGGKTAESLSMKTEEMDQIVADRADGKLVTKSSENEHAQIVQKDASPPTTSMEKSVNLQVLTISKEDCSQIAEKTSSRTSLLSSLSSSLSQSESSQALLSAIPVSSSGSFILKNHSKGQLTGSAETSRDAVYQHLLQGMCRSHLGPSLSLSSSTSMSEGGHYLQPQALSMSQSYSSGIDNTLPWLKAMELKPGIDYSTNQDQSVCLDGARIRHELATSVAGVATSQLRPPSIHNWLPVGSPPVIETSDWMLGSINRQKREHSSGMESSSTLPSSCGLEPHHMQLAPLQTAAVSDESTVQVTRAPIMNFLNSSQSDETDSTDDLSKLRFSEFNVLRSFESIYDSHSSFL